MGLASHPMQQGKTGSFLKVEYEHTYMTLKTPLGQVFSLNVGAYGRWVQLRFVRKGVLHVWVLSRKVSE